MTAKKSSALFLFPLFLTLICMTLQPLCAVKADAACPPLPAPTGATIAAATEQEIISAVASATPGTTVLIADGTYTGLDIWIHTDNITLRSTSGNRSAVVLDNNHSGGEIITVAASNATIADITIKRARTHPIHVVSSDSGDTVNTLIYNVHIIDPGQQAIKINPHAARVHFPDDGEVACSTLELTDAGRAEVWNINGSCYTGGVDGHFSRGWTIRENVIKGFWCPQGLSEHGVHFWTGSRDTVVERNRFINNARGIGFGLVESNNGRTYSDDPCPGAIGHVGHYDGIIRNNFISANHGPLFDSNSGADGGIALAQACGAQVFHNTVAFTQAPFAAIEWRFANTDATISNNLVTHNLMARSGTAATTGNLNNQPMSVFVDGPNGDLHLDGGATVAINTAITLAAGLSDDDFDGQTRPATGRDIGADEYQSDANTAPTAAPRSITVTEDSADNPITLSGSDADGDTLTYRVTASPTHGSLSGNPPSVSYTPQSGYTGNDTFSFCAHDGTADSTDATVSITVAPSVSNPGLSNPGTGNSGGGGGCFVQSVWR